MNLNFKATALKIIEYENVTSQKDEILCLGLEDGTVMIIDIKAKEDNVKFETKVSSEIQAISLIDEQIFFLSENMLYKIEKIDEKYNSILIKISKLSKKLKNIENSQPKSSDQTKNEFFIEGINDNLFIAYANNLLCIQLNSKVVLLRLFYTIF